MSFKGLSPNMSGMKEIDQPQAMYLAELALELSKSVLKENGALLVKVFQGSGLDTYQKELRSCFRKVKVRKPQASRARSRELYLLAAGLVLLRVLPVLFQFFEGRVFKFFALFGYLLFYILEALDEFVVGGSPK